MIALSVTNTGHSTRAGRVSCFIHSRHHVLGFCHLGNSAHISVSKGTSESTVCCCYKGLPTGLSPPSVFHQHMLVPLIHILYFQHYFTPLETFFGGVNLWILFYPTLKLKKGTTELGLMPFENFGDKFMLRYCLLRKVLEKLLERKTICSNGKKILWKYCTVKTVQFQ